MSRAVAGWLYASMDAFRVNYATDLMTGQREDQSIAEAGRAVETAPEQGVASALGRGSGYTAKGSYLTATQAARIERVQQAFTDARAGKGLFGLKD